MSLSIGIVGLPNVGKSTAFNALTKAQNAEVANYPFCTIKPNRAIVPVPDFRVEKLGELSNLNTMIHATIEFVDIAGLVQGASKGEGLGNQFLGNIRDTDAIIHVIRCFDDPNVVHISETIDPRSDIEIINFELMLADLEQLERKIERLSSQVKGDKNTFQPLLNTALDLKEQLGSGVPVALYPDKDVEAYRILNNEMRFLTGKPVIYAANVDEASLAEENDYVKVVREVAVENDAEVAVFCAKLEEELVEMTPEEQSEFLQLAGAEESGLEQTIRLSYSILGLISFFSMNEREVRAWTISKGTTAVKAAGVIHTDFERGFIRAEVISFDIFVEHGSAAATRAAGNLRLEGKEYIVQDGDVILFRFNV
jgi:GTP-binding protein YchF